ncbi:MAG TPA: hypothetical protein DET40_11105 [Lentisphaeria bacterium]|nr:MAG: hypothetical protein A2X45_20085 [Lentisphaerae bacterium GWF2_50_93]HCE44086.1 hypothetical protein [Lentisphaeria bacterium]
MRILSSICLLTMLAFTGFSADDAKDALRVKIEKITIEKIELQDVKLSNAIALIKDLCKKSDPEGKGINISFIAPKDDKGKALDPVIKNEINLTNIPLKDLLRYICDETGMNYKVEAFSVVIYPKNMATDKMETRSYPVAPGTVDSIEKEKK